MNDLDIIQSIMKTMLEQVYDREATIGDAGPGYNTLFNAKIYLTYGEEAYKLAKEGDFSFLRSR
jgi:hypothetical protein